MKIKTSELTGRALDYAVAICEGWDSDYLIKNPDAIPEYSTDWSECGPLIDECFISLIERTKCWCADRPGFDVITGKTAKEAICRAIATELDDEIEIPDELIKLWDE